MLLYHFNYYFGSVQLVQTNSIRTLEVHYDHKFTFNEHVILTYASILKYQVSSFVTMIPPQILNYTDRYGPAQRGPANLHDLLFERNKREEASKMRKWFTLSIKREIIYFLNWREINKICFSISDCHIKKIELLDRPRLQH